MIEPAWLVQWPVQTLDDRYITINSHPHEIKRIKQEQNNNELSREWLKRVNDEERENGYEKQTHSREEDGDLSVGVDVDW